MLRSFSVDGPILEEKETALREVRQFAVKYGRRSEMLAQAWANFHYFGCSYHPEIEKIIHSWPPPKKRKREISATGEKGANRQSQKKVCREKPHETHQKSRHTKSRKPQPSSRRVYRPKNPSTRPRNRTTQKNTSSPNPTASPKTTASKSGVSRHKSGPRPNMPNPTPSSLPSYRNPSILNPNLGHSHLPSNSAASPRKNKSSLSPHAATFVPRRFQTSPSLTIPNTALPNPTIPDTAPPNPTIPNTASPNPSIPNTAAQTPTIPNTTSPNPTIPNTAAPNHALSSSSDSTLPTTLNPTNLFAHTAPHDITPTLDHIPPTQSGDMSLTSTSTTLSSPAAANRVITSHSENCQYNTSIPHVPTTPLASNFVSQDSTANISTLTASLRDAQMLGDSDDSNACSSGIANTNSETKRKPRKRRSRPTQSFYGAKFRSRRLSEKNQPDSKCEEGKTREVKRKPREVKGKSREAKSKSPQAKKKGRGSELR